jgi:hypothetical protein
LKCREGGRGEAMKFVNERKEKEKKSKQENA